jgi:Leucine-rich repeat (LRR) protein
MVPKLRQLSLFSKDVTNPPIQVKQITFTPCCGNMKKIIGVEILEMFSTNEYDLNVLKIYSETIRKLYVSAHILSISLLCFCPNLATLSCSANFITNMDCLWKKFPNLTTLDITLWEWTDLSELKGFPFRIVLSSDHLINTQCFIDFKCRELDLSLCLNIQDYSSVAHIPIVIKK